MKQIIKTILICLGLFLTLTSCEKDQNKKRASTASSFYKETIFKNVESFVFKTSLEDTSKTWQTLKDAIPKAPDSLKTPEVRAEFLKKIVFENWGVTFDPIDTTLENNLPHLVFKNKKGSCVGTSLLLLMVAEHQGWPVYGVLLPNHLFLRYDDGKTQINIEPNKSGYFRNNDYYRKQYKVENDDFYNLRNLKHKELLSVWYFTLGNCERMMGHVDLSIDYYKKAILGFPNYAEVYGNLAIAYTLNKNYSKATKILEIAQKQRPNLQGLSDNLMKLYIHTKSYKKIEILKKKMADK